MQTEQQPIPDLHAFEEEIETTLISRQALITHDGELIVPDTRKYKHAPNLKNIIFGIGRVAEKARAVSIFIKDSVVYTLAMEGFMFGAIVRAEMADEGQELAYPGC